MLRIDQRRNYFYGLWLARVSGMNHSESQTLAKRLALHSDMSEEQILYFANQLFNKKGISVSQDILIDKLRMSKQRAFDYT